MRHVEDCLGKQYDHCRDERYSAQKLRKMIIGRKERRKRGRENKKVYTTSKKEKKIEGYCNATSK